MHRHEASEGASEACQGQGSCHGEPAITGELPPAVLHATFMILSLMLWLMSCLPHILLCSAVTFVCICLTLWLVSAV